MKEFLYVSPGQIPDLLDKYRVNTDKKIISIINSIALHPYDTNRRLQLLRQIGKPILQNMLFGKPYKETTEEANGLIKLAITDSNKQVGIYPHEAHHLIAGQTGCGKTTLLFIIFLQAMLQNITCWLFVRSKEARILTRGILDVIVVNFDGQVKINPLVNPPGLTKYAWINVFSDTLIQAFRLYDGTKNFLIEQLNNLYSQFESYGYYPSLSDIYEAIKEQKFPQISRTARYRESALNRLAGLITGPLGNTFNCSKGYEEQLTKHNVIFEIDNLTSEQQVFIVNLLTTWLFYHKLNKGE